MYEFRDFDKTQYSPEKCVEDLFKTMDKNNDNKLSKEEFVEECLASEQILRLLSPFEI